MGGLPTFATTGNASIFAPHDDYWGSWWQGTNRLLTRHLETDRVSFYELTAVQGQVQRFSSGKKLLTKLDSFRQAWVRGATDNASAYGAEDCRFESCRTLKTFFPFFSFTFFSNCFFNAINCSRSSSCCCCNLFLVYSNSLRTLSYFCL